MNPLDRIKVAASDPGSLDKFLSKNASEITDWLNILPHNELLTLRPQFRDFILLRGKIWRNLPKTGTNLAFLALLLEKMEQLGDTGTFGRLFHEIRKSPYELGSRLTAASLYMSQEVANAEQLIAQYGPIYHLLKEAVENEDDNSDKSIATLIQYYLLAIDGFGQFNIGVPNKIKGLIEGTLTGDPNSFLCCPLVFNTLSVPLTSYRDASEAIRQLLDEYLGRDKAIIDVETGILVEVNTEYCDLLEKVSSDYDEIRNISYNKHLANPNGQAAYNSLKRGINIINSEEQLWAYMTAFGPMHSEKLLHAFGKVGFNEMQKPVSVIDWGAGQGFATMMLFDYLNKSSIDLEIQKVVLIEPSQFALKRGGLHSLKFDASIALNTINKQLDNLEPNDIRVANGTAIHLFSNILDVDSVSLSKLHRLILDTFPGKNYFICCSPHINDTKTQRLVTFMESFEEHGLELIYEITNAKKDWNGKWTRAIRVFATTI